MGHEEYLLRLLRPLGVYDLRAASVNRGELAAYGSSLDMGLEQLERMEREMTLATAEGEGLDAVEALLPYRPASQTAKERREALAALLSQLPALAEAEICVPPSRETAARRAVADLQEEDALVVFGSLYLAAEMRQALRNELNR